jgi:hypothetical protein
LRDLFVSTIETRTTMNENSLRNLVHKTNLPRPRMSAIANARMMQALVDGATRQEIIEETGLSYDTIRDYVNAMLKPAEGPRVVYICDWQMDRTGRYSTPVFKWGVGKTNAKKPRKCRNQVAREYRARKKMKEAFYGIGRAITGGESHINA